MKITYNEFEVLVVLEREKKKLTQRELSTETGVSVGTINKVLNDLENKGLIKDYYITDKALEVLEPYKVKRAIFLAAGFGSRLVPITLNTPKPLVRVKGKRIIETELDACVKAGIEEIIIVTGYLKEQFEELRNKYDNIKIIVNEKYNEANNILSAVKVKDYFENSYVLEADLLIHNPNIIRKYEYNSNFLGFKVDRSDDWCLDVKNGIIVKEKVGGINTYQMVGISYYDSEDGKKMKKDIEEVYNEPGGKEKYWEQVMLSIRKKNYKINIRECNKNDVIEIDTFNELKQIDKTYDC